LLLLLLLFGLVISSNKVPLCLLNPVFRTIVPCLGSSVVRALACISHRRVYCIGTLFRGRDTFTPTLFIQVTEVRVADTLTIWYQSLKFFDQVP
ncbi:hypothetical protein WDU94_014994, partial [Cyamophila willieti]